MRRYFFLGGLFVLAIFSTVLSLGHAHGIDIDVPGDQIDKRTLSRNRNVENVFLIVIDGLRNSEAFKDPTHKYIPRIWNDLKPLGTTYLNFFSLGRTDTTPGHYAMASGSSGMLPSSATGKLSAQASLPYTIAPVTPWQETIVVPLRLIAGLKHTPRK